MPAAVACPKCKKKYNLPDKLLGKPVKCTACETLFKTPAHSARGQSKQRPAAGTDQSAARKKAQALAQQRAAELTKLGIETTIRHEPDIFAGAGPVRGSDPLANHMIEDPGFGESSTAIHVEEKIEKDDDPLAQMFVNPALQTGKKKKRLSGDGKRASLGLASQPWMMLTVVFVPVFAVLIGLTLGNVIPSATAGIVAAIAVGLLALANLAILIWGMVLVYQTTPSVLQVILCLFVPFYIIYYIVVHWDDMKDFAYALIAQFLISPLAGTSMVVAGMSQTTGS